VADTQYPQPRAEEHRREGRWSLSAGERGDRRRCEHDTPDFLHLPEEMKLLIEWHEQAGQMHVVERASELHTRFVKIQPFIDGNGRTGRLLLNFELMKAGYPPAIIRKEDRLAYYDSLDDACSNGDFSGITQLVANSVQRSLDTYLDVLGLRKEHRQ
jgi:Fic family protein